MRMSNQLYAQDMKRTSGLQETMMDHPLRTISYIADIGNIVVLMARRRMPRPDSQESVEASDPGQDSKRQYKMICHVFESEDVSPTAILSAFAQHTFELFWYDVSSSLNMFKTYLPKMKMYNLCEDANSF